MMALREKAATNVSRKPTKMLRFVALILWLCVGLAAYFVLIYIQVSPPTPLLHLTLDCADRTDPCLKEEFLLGLPKLVKEPASGYHTVEGHRKIDVSKDQDSLGLGSIKQNNVVGSRIPADRKPRERIMDYSEANDKNFPLTQLAPKQGSNFGVAINELAIVRDSDSPCKLRFRNVPRSVADAIGSSKTMLLGKAEMSPYCRRTTAYSKLIADVMYSHGYLS
jgi:hypothetical protein